MGDCQRDFDPVPVHSQPNLQKLPEVATSHDLIVLEDSSNETNDDSVNPDKNSRMASTVEQIDALQTFVSSEPGLDTSDVQGARRLVRPSFIKMEDSADTFGAGAVGHSTQDRSGMGHDPGLLPSSERSMGAGNVLQRPSTNENVGNDLLTGPEIHRYQPLFQDDNFGQRRRISEYGDVGSKRLPRYDTIKVILFLKQDCFEIPTRRVISLALVEDCRSKCPDRKIKLTF